MKKQITYAGLGLMILGVLNVIFTNQTAHLWISGTGATLFALSLLIENLTHEWKMKFAEVEQKMNGTHDSVKHMFVQIDQVKQEMAALEPDAIEELTMRVENLEGARGLQRAFSLDQPEIYKPKAKLKS